ncbi:MAG: type II secretion system F family protein [Myxococcales bacterium]|nr:type II secretion system F family protein [Myxococcales bacterium]
MAEWVWEGRTRTGEVKKGVMQADAERDVMLKLRQQNIQPLTVKKKGKSLNLPSMGGGVSQAQLVVFVRQFATMIDAGLPLVQCLEILGNQEPHKTFKRVILDVKANVEGGATFADSLKRHPIVFDNLFCNLVAAGEIGGILDTILNRLATYIEKNVKLVRQVKGAMVYPVAILVIALVVVAALLKYVIPTFENMFADLGDAKLPALTQFVIGASHWFQANFMAIVVIGGAAFYGFKWALRQEKGKEIFDTVMLKLPLFGPLLRKVAVAKFTRTLGTMIASGVPILDALDIVAKSAGNKVIERAIYFVREKISEGSNMAEPLAKTNVFPSMVVQMIAVGESTGAMDTMLQKIADFYEEEVEVAVGSLTKLLEPLMMVFIGGIVGTVLIAMYLPIFEIAGNVKTS